MNKAASMDSSELSNDPLIQNSDVSNVRRNRMSTQNFFTSFIPLEIDVFGFSLEPKHFLIVLLAATIILGLGGSE